VSADAGRPFRSFSVAFGPARLHFALGMPMTTRRKFTILGVGAALAIFAAPVVWSAVSTHAYFYVGRCAGGHCIFVRIRCDGYFSYAPGHGVPESRDFKVRRTVEGWELLGRRLPLCDDSPPEGEDTVVAYLRLRRGGALYSSWDAGRNWQRFPRVYNIWRLWAAKLFERFPSPNQSRQPTPGERLGFNREPVARRGCALR